MATQNSAVLSNNTVPDFLKSEKVSLPETHLDKDEVACMVKPEKIASKKRGHRILRYAKARWGETKVPLNQLTVDSSISSESLQKITHMSWLYDRRWSLMLILRDPQGLKAFREFLSSEYASENLLFWLEIESLKSIQNRQQLKTIATSLLEKFFKEDCINITDRERTEFVSMLKAMTMDDEGDIEIEEDVDFHTPEGADRKIAKDDDTDSVISSSNSMMSRKSQRTCNSNVSDGEANLMDSVQNSVLSLMAMDCLPRFLVSKYGEKYLKYLADRPMIDTTIDSDMEFKSRLLKFHAQAKSVSKSSPTAWITKFISMAYMLPFCVTISTRVNSEGPEGNFPLSFVNPEFTRTTGFTHEETVGRNCRFLQGKNTDKNDVAKLHYGIQKGVKVHTSIINYTKDGEEFKNLLTLHPVFNKKGVHVFVVGIQYDVSDMNMTKIAALSPILEFLSDSIQI
eukprot:CFRG6292T1